MLETERFILRPWRDADAATLFRWASDPRVGPPANWAPYVNIEHAREVLHAVYCAPDTFAICAKHPEEFDAAAIARIEGAADFGDMTRGFSGRAFLRERKKVASAPLNPIGSIRFVKPDHANCSIEDNDREMGIWLAAPFWGFGIAPEVAGAMLHYGFGERGLSAIWVCNFVENATSARAKDKLGFELVRLEEATNPVTGVVRTQQVSVLTKSSWENMQKATESIGHSQAALFFGAAQSIKGSPIA